MSYPKDRLEGKHFKAGRFFMCCFIISIIAAYFHLHITLALVAHTQIKKKKQQNPNKPIMSLWHVMYVWWIKQLASTVSFQAMEYSYF